jgi:hypothetical protein
VNILDFNKPQNNKKKKIEEEQKNEIKEERKSILSDDELFDLYINEDVTHILEVPLYPHDFINQQGGKKISHDLVNEWIEECIYFLEQEPQEQYASFESGDTKVVVVRRYDNEDSYYYTIDVYKNRYTIEISPQEL